MIKEFQRLKEEEHSRLSIEWNLSRNLAKLNYRIHTDTIKAHMIPPKISSEEASSIYSNEADVLNMALFGKTAKQWREDNPKKEGHIREFASIKELLVLANIEAINAEFIRMKMPQFERLKKLNEVDINQLQSLNGYPLMKKISEN